MSKPATGGVKTATATGPTSKAAPPAATAVAGGPAPAVAPKITSAFSPGGRAVAASGAANVKSGPGVGLAAASGGVKTGGAIADAANPATAPTPKATVATLAASLATTRNPAAALDSVTGSRVETAIAKGMDATQAKQAGNTYNAALVKQLSKGLPMSEAVAKAEAVFKAEAGFPKPKSPQEAAVKNLAAGGNDVAKQLTTLAKAGTSAGSAALDKSLASSLAKGMSFADAVKTAQAAVRQADVLAKADNTPQSGLASGSAAAKVLANRSAVSQTALSGLLAKGVPLDQAMQRADQIAVGAAGAAQADARNPASSVASGNLSALPGRSAGGGSDNVLAAALAKGLPMDVAIKQAQQTSANEQKAIEVDARNPTTGFSSGRSVPAATDPAFDRALTNAIARGQTPDQALASANLATTRLAPAKPTPTSALASGQNVATVLLGGGTSRAYTNALGNALARGVPVEQAMALAKRIEQASAAGR